MRTCEHYVPCVKMRYFKFVCEVDGHEIKFGDKCVFKKEDVDTSEESDQYCMECSYGDPDYPTGTAICSIDGEEKQQYDTCRQFSRRRR